MKVKKAGPKFTLLQHRKLYSCALDRPTKAVSRDAMGFRVLEKSCEARCQTRFGLNLAVLAAQISEARCQTESLRLEFGRVSAPPGCALDRPNVGLCLGPLEPL